VHAHPKGIEFVVLASSGSCARCWHIQACERNGSSKDIKSEWRRFRTDTKGALDRESIRRALSLNRPHFRGRNVGSLTGNLIMIKENCSLVWIAMRSHKLFLGDSVARTRAYSLDGLRNSVP